MHVRRTVARLAGIAVVATAALAGGATSAWAADTLTIQSGSPALNDGNHQVVIHANGTYVGSPAPQPTVTFSRTANTGDTITAASAVVGSDGHTITATANFAMANPGSYNVSVTQSGGATSDTCTGCMTVAAFKPAVTSVSPSQLAQGTTGGFLDGFTINGSNFTKGPYAVCATAPCAGPSIAIVDHGTTTVDPTVTLSNVVVTNSSQITARISVNGSQPLHGDDVVLTNSDGKVATCSNCLTIYPQPTITAVTLQATGGNTIGQNATGQTIILTGHDFPSDSKITWVPPSSSGSGTITNGTPTVDSPTQITIPDVDTTGVTQTGTWGVFVSSPSLHAVSGTKPFTVDAPPTPSGVVYTDASGGATDYGQGAQSVRFTVQMSGASFVAGSGSALHTQVRFLNLPSGVSVTNQVATAGSPDTVQVTLSIPGDATTGSYQIEVVNPDGGVSAPCDNSTTVPPAANTCLLTIGAAPSVTSLSPNTVTGGFSGAVTVNGANFHAAGVHAVLGPSGSPYFDGSATFTNANKITLPSVSVPANATATDTDLVLTNTDDLGTSTSTDVFHVANLSVTSVTPNNDTNDDASAMLTINGTHLSGSATVSLVKHVTDSLGQPQTITIPGTSVSGGGSSLSATFDLAGADPGAYDVTVTNPSNDPNPGTASCPGCFTVVAAAPTISTVTPDKLGGGATNQTVTIDGAHFEPHVTVSFSNSHVHLQADPTVVSSTELQVPVSVDATATNDTGTVTVTDTAGQTGSQAFTVDTGPTITSITPAARAAGSGPFTFTVKGSNFASDATLSFSDPSVTASNVQVNPDGQSITASVTIPASVAPAGGAPKPVHVTVTNQGDQGTATSATDLTADPEPVISRFSPDALAPGSSRTVQILGSGFLDGATVAPHGSSSGLTFGTPNVVSGSEIDVTVTVAASAARGPRQVDLANPDGGQASGTLDVVEAPSAPRDLHVRGGDGSIVAAWAAPADNGGGAVSSYTLTLTRHRDGAAVGRFTTPNGTTFRHTFAGLTNGTRYDVSVVATNAAGSGPAAKGSATPKFRTRLTIRSSRSTVAPGVAAVVKGRLLRSNHQGVPKARLVVFRSRHRHGGYAAYAIVRTARSGKWRLPVKPTRTTRYRAVFTGDAADRASTSGSVRVRVRRHWSVLA